MESVHYGKLSCCGGLLTSAISPFSCKHVADDTASSSGSMAGINFNGTMRSIATFRRRSRQQCHASVGLD